HKHVHTDTHIHAHTHTHTHRHTQTARVYIRTHTHTHTIFLSLSLSLTQRRSDASAHTHTGNLQLLTSFFRVFCFLLHSIKSAPYFFSVSVCFSIPPFPGLIPSSSPPSHSHTFFSLSFLPKLSPSLS